MSSTFNRITPVFKPIIGTWQQNEESILHQPVDQSGNVCDKERALSRLIIPDGSAQSFRFTVTVNFDPNFPVAVCTDERFQHFTTLQYSKQNVLISDGQDLNYYPIDQEIKDQVSIEIIADSDQIQFILNDQLINQYQRQFKNPYYFIELVSHGKAEWINPIFEIDGYQKSSYKAQPKENFTVSVSCDYVMDLLRMGLNFRKTNLDIPGKDWSFLKQYMQSFADVGIQKINWIVNDALPEIVNQTAVKAAHEVGLEFYVTLKLFDVGDTDFKDNSKNKLPADKYGYDYPETYSMHAPLDDKWAPMDSPIEKICIYRNNTDAFDEKNLSIWVSDDGQTFKPYQGPSEIKNTIEAKAFKNIWYQNTDPEQDVRCIRFEGLHIATPYFAIACKPCPDNVFTNRLNRLIEFYDCNQKKVYVQYGLQLKPPSEEAFLNTKRSSGTLTFNILASSKMPEDLLQQPIGQNSSCSLDFLWNLSIHQNNGICAGTDDYERSCVLNNDNNIIGFKREFEPYSRRFFSPASSTARKFFLNWTKKWLDHDVDGIDLRVRSHSRTLSMSNLHFNPEACKAYHEKYGEELNINTVNREKHQRLMGEFYTSLVEEISKEVRNRGKKLFHHLHPSMIADPAKERCHFNIHYDWQLWIKKGLLDGFTLKEVFPHTIAFETMMPHLLQTGLPIFITRHILNTLSQYDYKNNVDGNFKEASDAGLHGYDIYEASAFVNSDEPGKSKLVREHIPEIVQRAKSRYR